MIQFEGRVFKTSKERSQWLRKKNKRIDSISKNLRQSRVEDGVQSLLFVWSPNVLEGRDSFFVNGPVMEEVFESPEGKAFKEKFLKSVKHEHEKHVLIIFVYFYIVMRGPGKIETG